MSNAPHPDTPGRRRRIAVIGAGPAGAITIDALAQEGCFDTIRVFERREEAGGCWLPDPPNQAPPPLTNLAGLAGRQAERPRSDIPSTIPCERAAPATDATAALCASSSLYPTLETNVHATAMAFSAEPIAAERSGWSVAVHGPDTPFRRWEVMRAYVRGLVGRRGYGRWVSYGTEVVRVWKEGEGGEWRVWLCRRRDGREAWWEERFDGVVVAGAGRWSVPYVPAVKGLEGWLARWGPAAGLRHSKGYRGREEWRGKRVVVVGASVSAADIVTDLLGVVRGKVIAVVEGHTTNVFFGDLAFRHPGVERKPSVAEVVPEGRIVRFVDGSEVSGVDGIIFGTGYTWSLPFLQSAGVEVRNNRVPGLYQHVVLRKDPSLVFVGAISPGLSFKVFEWQAILAARVLAGRAHLPPVEEQERWEAERVRVKGDGAGFTVEYPDLPRYFETLRTLAGEPRDGKGRRLPEFQQEWMDAFMAGHELRKAMWRRNNEEAWRKLEEGEKKKKDEGEKARL